MKLRTVAKTGRRMEMSISESFRHLAPWFGLAFVAVALTFVWRSFYKMRIDDGEEV